MDDNSAKFNKEDLALQKIIKDILGVTKRRPTGSIRKEAIKRNIVKDIKSTDLSSTNSCLSDNGQENKEINAKEVKSSLEDAAVAKKSRQDSLSRNKFKLKKVQLDAELERLRRTVRKCHAALEPVQNYTDRRLEYYNSISNKKTSENESRKRKYIEEESSDEEIWEEVDKPDEYLWTCELDGLKVNFKKLNVEK